MRHHIEKSPHSIVFGETVNDLYDNHRYHFDGKNVGKGATRHTSLDWFLVPIERPSIEEAQVKEHYIDIPGTNGGLDLTESLTGFPLYNMIEGSFEFRILNEKKLTVIDTYSNVRETKDISWETLNRDIREFLNGKKRYMMFEDDPSFYYEGRFTVGKYDSSENIASKIVIKYKVYPFKRLSTYIYNIAPLNTFFDTVSLNNDDTALLVESFRDKTKVELYPNNNPTIHAKKYRGNIAGELACGGEAVQLIFGVESLTHGYKLSVKLESKNETITKQLPYSDEEYTQRVRDMVLTNVSSKGSLYSDDELTVYLNFADAFSSSTPYKKDDVVTVTSTSNNLKWIVKATEDLAAGDFDISKWDVCDEIKIEEFNPLLPRKRGDVVYKKENNNFVLYRFNSPSSVEIISTLDTKDFYNPVIFSVLYDIGVM